MDNYPNFYILPVDEMIKEEKKMNWLIKGMIPFNGISMIFGESGVGKSFVAVDIACRVSLGLSFNKRNISCGKVLYLAGEGNSGLSMRFKAWSKLNNVHSLPNLYVSSEAIDLDSDDSINAIIQRTMLENENKYVLIIIDTLNNHMSGDENSAMDTRNFVGKCKKLSNVLGGTIMFVHHLGHNASDRSRGSSAWKATLDSSFLLKKGDGNEIVLSCTKLKDGPLIREITGRIVNVDLGYKDSDNEPVIAGAFSILRGR